MAMRNISHLISLLALRGEIVFSFDQFTAHPQTKTQAATFGKLRDDWNTIFAEELARRDGVTAANARIISISFTLNTLASRVSKAVLVVTDDDRTHALYSAYFKDKTLSEFKRPVMGSKLESLRGWIQPLKTSNVPALAALGPEVEAAVAAADEVLAARGTLETENTFFREAGNRKKFFDKVNATRKTVYGEVASMPHENMSLPSNFADQFFLHDTAKDEEPTIEAVDEEIAALELQLEEKKELRAKLEEEAEQAEKEEAEKAAREATVAELQKVVAEGERQIAEVRAQIAALLR